MITYPEFSKSAAAELGCKMVSIDIGGGMSFQGPATPAQQAKLAGIAATIAADNEELIGKMPAATATVQAKQAAAKAKRDAKASEQTSGTSNKKGGK